MSNNDNAGIGEKKFKTPNKRVLKSELSITDKNTHKKIVFQEVYSSSKTQYKPIIKPNKNDSKNGFFKLNINSDKLNTTNNAINIINANIVETKRKKLNMSKKHLSFDYNASRVPSPSSTTYFHSNAPSIENSSNANLKTYFNTKVNSLHSDSKIKANKNTNLNSNSINSNNRSNDYNNYYFQTKLKSKLIDKENILKNELNNFSKSYKEFKHTKTRSSSYNSPLVLNSLNQKKIFNSILIGNSSKGLVDIQNLKDKDLSNFHQRTGSLNLSNKKNINIKEINTRLIQEKNNINQRTIDSLLRNNQLPSETNSCEKMKNKSIDTRSKSKLKDKKISLEKEKNKSKKILKQTFKDCINSNTKEIEKIKSKIRDIFKERQNKEKE